MSLKHLTVGSDLPPKHADKLRLYSMNFCPYAERARLVLLRKNIPHDIVNVDLKRKPEWIFNLHPEGKVPILDTGSKVIIESIDICDYLDEEYPDPPLYPKDEGQRQEDKEFVKYCDNVIALYMKAIVNANDSSLDEYIQNMTPYLIKIEKELQKRGTYFGGDEPSMVDYMIWPWGERAEVLAISFKQELPGDNTYPCLYRWCKAMRKRKEVEETVVTADRFYKLALQYKNSPHLVQYDSI